MLGPSSILSRTSFASIPRLPSLQVQVDSLVGRFVEEAVNPTTLAALMAGGMAYRIGRVGVMATGSGPIAAMPLRMLSVGVGLGTEVTAFEFTNRSLATLSGHQTNPNLWRWGGQGGWAQGLSTSAITFGMLKGAGFVAREQNLVFQHALQSGAMVVGQNTAGIFGITARPEGSLAEQFLHAEATNLQLGAGISLLHAVAPGIHAMERSLDLVGARQENPWSSRSLENHGPSFALAMAEERNSTPPRLSGSHPVPLSTNLMSMIGEGGGSGRPSPGELRESLATIWERGSENSPTEIQSVAKHFSIDSEHISRWLSNLRHMASNVGREESPERSLKILEEVLEDSRNQPQLLDKLSQFFSYTANDFQAPQRELQTFSDLVEMGLGAVHLYERLGISMNAAEPRPFGREALGEGYFMEISPGEGEAAGGLHVTLLRSEGNLLFHGGTPLAEVGILVGRDRVQVVFVQGEKGHYSAHVNRLRLLLGQDPFDWLLQAVTQWATAEGFKRMEAFGHTHNYWLRNRLAQLGEGPEGQAYRVHLSRLYEGRFLRLGLQSSVERPSLFMKPLEGTPGGETSAVADLLRRILRPVEPAQTIPHPVLSHVHRLIFSRPPSGQTPFHPSTFETGKKILGAALEQPETQPLLVEHLLSLEETHPPQTISDYIFAAGYHSERGRTPLQILEILSTRLNEGSETQSFYRGLGRIELLVWRFGHELASRKSNREKILSAEIMLGELKERQGYNDLWERMKEVLEHLKREDPSSLRVSQATFLEMVDLFHERSMQHMFFSRHPSETAAQFANIGGLLLRLDLPARLIARMNPMSGQHVAFSKSNQNLALMIYHFRPNRVYQGDEGIERALREAPALSSTGILTHRPVAELPLYIPPPLIALVEAAYQHPPARHIKNQIWLGKTVKALAKVFQDGRGGGIESSATLENGNTPERAFELLREWNQGGLR